jgi:glutamate N-acetyltransferase/amino-acid N-acetyltransferase
MAVNLEPPSGLLPVKGVRLGAAEAAVKKPGRADVAVVALAQGTHTAAVFTKNVFRAAPVIMAQQRVNAVSPRAFVINSGNANAGTGRQGLVDAQACTAALAEQLGYVDSDAVLPFSTGVIGEPLPVQRIREALPAAVADLSENGWQRAAQAIMTTDTVPKAVSRRVDLDGHTITITGMAKGSGMIRPDMATMLAFVATDAVIEPAALECCLREAVDTSFHCVTVDGDTSTNDAVTLSATGRAGNPAIITDSPSFATLRDAITAVCVALAQGVVRDGEGANHFITVAVEGALDIAEARRVAFTVAQSPLVKTTCFAGDPNWGRILAAVGRAGVESLELSGVDIFLDDVCLVRGGEPDAGYSEDRAAAVMARSEYVIHVQLGRGGVGTRVWTCDLSYDYVRINAEYRT